MLQSGYLPSLLMAIAKLDYFCVFLFALLCMIFCPKKSHLKMESLLLLVVQFHWKALQKENSNHLEQTPADKVAKETVDRAASSASLIIPCNIYFQENPDSDNVRVCVRCRPINEKEIDQGCNPVVQVSLGKILDFSNMYCWDHVSWQIHGYLLVFFEMCRK